MPFVYVFVNGADWLAFTATTFLSKFVLCAWRLQECHWFKTTTPHAWR